MEFNSWDAALYLRDDHLEHHGIQGMKWGVRRYQNKDGSLTKAGEKRYGANSTKRTSARRMQKDLNRLDQGYANTEAYRKKNVLKTRKYALKAYKGANSKKREEKLREKAIKYGKKAALNQKQKEAIEKLQFKILGKAANKRYTTIGEPTVRYGKRKAQNIMDKLTNFNTGYAVNGQNFSVKKHGSGKTSIVNYNAAKAPDVIKYITEERNKELAKKYKNVNR